MTMAQSFRLTFEDFMNKLEAFALSLQFTSNSEITDAMAGLLITNRLLQEFLMKERSTFVASTTAATSTRNNIISPKRDPAYALKRPLMHSTKPTA
jgi:hypothetical protein